MSLSGSMTAAISATQTPASAPLQSTATDKVVDGEVFSFTDGSGDSQANKIWREDYTISASGTQTIDLVGGGLTDRFGASVSFTTIKGLMLTVQTTDGEVVISPAGANAFDALFGSGADIPVKEGGVLCWFAPNDGVSVSAGSDSLTLTNSSGAASVTCQLTIIGT